MCKRLRIGVGAFGPSLVIRNFAKRPDCMRCDLRVAYFCFPPFNCLPPAHSADCLGDPVNCHFTCWILGFMPQISQPLFVLQGDDPGPAAHCLVPKV